MIRCITGGTDVEGESRDGVEEEWLILLTPNDSSEPSSLGMTLKRGARKWEEGPLAMGGVVSTLGACSHAMSSQSATTAYRSFLILDSALWGSGFHGD